MGNTFLGEQVVRCSLLYVISNNNNLFLKLFYDCYVAFRIMVICIGVGLCLVLCVVICVCCVMKKKKRARNATKVATIRFLAFCYYVCIKKQMNSGIENTC